MKREFEVEEVKSCPICKNQSVVDMIEKYDDRFGQPDLFEYGYCECCNISFLRDKIREKYLSELYKKYYGKGRRLSDKSSKLKSILEKIKLDKLIFEGLAGNKILLSNAKNNSKVLEIGSGYSPDLKKNILAKNLDWTGVEVDKDLVESLRKDRLKVFFGVLGKNNIQDKFDYVISSQSLEHQYDINDFFQNSKKLLEKHGKIVFTTPNFDSRYRKKYKERWINWHAPYHITILSRTGIENLCKEHGFTVSRFFTYTPTSWYMLQKKFEIMERGKTNNNFNFDFTLTEQLFASLFLRIYEYFNRINGDCIYCEIKVKHQ